MDFIDTHEPGRKLSFLAYPDDISSGVINRASSYTRQLEDIDPDAQIVFDNLPRSLWYYEKAAINNFVKNCKTHDNWDGIKEIVCYGLVNEINARAGFRGVLGTATLRGRRSHPSEYGILKVREGWDIKGGERPPDGGAYIDTFPSIRISDLFLNIPITDAFVGVYIHSSRQPELTAQSWCFSNNGVADAFAMGTYGNVDPGGTRALNFYLSTDSPLHYDADGQIGDPGVQKRFYLWGVDPSGGPTSRLYVNGVSKMSADKTYSAAWNHNKFSILTGNYQTQAYTLTNRPANITYSFAVWGQFSLISQATLYEDLMQLLRDLKIDV